MSISDLIVNSDMYSYEYFLQEDICRFCWSKNATRLIVAETLPNPCEFQNQLQHKIKQALDILIDEETIPKVICESCYDKINSFYDFKCFCTESNEKLQEILKQNCNPITESGVKAEKNEVFENILEAKSDSFDSFLDCLQTDSDFGLLEQGIKKKTIKKKKYHLKRSPTYCNICHLDFESDVEFTKHNSLCHGVEATGEFKCFGCEKKFQSRKSRLGHEINFCKGLKDGYKCSQCERFLPKRRMYETHMKNHRNNTISDLPDELFKCPRCTEVFKTKMNLKGHIADVHDGTKNFVCEKCGRVFTRQDYLHKHKLTHTGIKQHVCTHCGFKTTQRSSLVIHIRKHTGERPYACTLCPLRCVSSSNLRAHMRCHLGQKLYECTICFKKFCYKISLEEHVAAIHEKSQSHPCQHCGATYTRIRGLKRHLLAKHGPNSKQSEVTEQSREIVLQIVTDEKEGVNEIIYEGEGFIL